MMLPAPVQFDVLESAQSGRSDELFVVFASPEKRCLGVAQRFGNYRAERICLIEIVDEPNTDREKNIAQLRALCEPVGPVLPCPFQHADPVFGLDRLAVLFQSVSSQGWITVDISTFPRNALLLTLRAIDRFGLGRRVRLAYTEAAQYHSTIAEPVSYGLQRVTVIPTFVAPYTAKEELVLIIFLGYERDRALGLWQSIEPHKTIAIIPRPAYHLEWEGATERINSALLAGLDKANVRYVDARDPAGAYEFLKSCVQDSAFPPNTNFYIAPLGTKPQAVGVYAFCRDFPEAATVVYSSPIEHNHSYISDGIGRSWILPFPGPGQ